MGEKQEQTDTGGAGQSGGERRWEQVAERVENTPEAEGREIAGRVPPTTQQGERSGDERGGASDRGRVKN